MNSPVIDESVGDRSSMSPEGRAMNHLWKKTANSYYSSSQSNPMDSRDRTPEDSDDESPPVIDESVGDRSSMSPEGRAMNQLWKKTANSYYSSSQSNPMDSRDRTPPESDDEGQLVIDEESRNAQQNLRLVTEVIQMFEIEEEMTSQASPIPTPVMAPINPEDESSSTEQIGQQHQSTEELIRVHDSEDMFHESDVGSVIEGTPVVRRIKKPNRASKRGSVGDVDELTKRKSQRFTTTDEADSTENLIDASQLELSTPAVNPSSSSNGQQPLHQPKMLTRGDLYDDNDEKQNELIGKEAGYANSTNKPKDSELSRLELFRVQCQLSKLPAPLPFEVFDKKDWNYVTTFDKKLLAPDESFLSVQVLAEIPRRHSRFPFCHPGPVVDTVSGTEDWYYADSIVQEVKLVRRIQPHYIVRWIGYEDSYNTVEPQSNLVGTAVLILHQKRDHFIGAGASGPTVIRRSTRIMAKRFEQVLHNGNEQVSQCRELQLLDSQLELEERADRYSPAQGRIKVFSATGKRNLSANFLFVESYVSESIEMDDSVKIEVE